MATRSTDRGSRDVRAPRTGSGSPSTRASRREGGAATHTSFGERHIAGVPARIMAPRLVFIACLIALVAFGLLMVYSSSAHTAVSSANPKPSTYYLSRQAIFAAGGAIFAIVVTHIPLDRYGERTLFAIWLLCVISLGVVLVIGAGAGGAVRWIDLGFFSLQPSEIAKPFLILTAANILAEYYDLMNLDTVGFIKLFAVAMAFPLLLIVAQPDFGTTIILAATIMVMLLFAGAPWRLLGSIFVVGLILLGIVFIIEPYRVERFLVAQDPWADMFDSGYQATIAIMAFASGGLFGRGIGNATMKYNFLPELHNDFILAIIGEEMGFVGTIAFFAVFTALLVSGYKIAREASSMRDRLTAYGCTTILGVQFLVNTLGILGVTPMTGKTLPFISYGGSSMVACLILAGYIIRVSIDSNRRTVYDDRRSEFAVMGAHRAFTGQDGVSSHIGRSTAGEPRRRSSREGGRGGGCRPGFSVMDGSGGSGYPEGDAASGPRGTRPRPDGRRSTSGAFGRVNLNDNPSERLRSRGAGPEVRGGQRARGGSRGRGADSYGTRRGRYDR